jgi:hypothetical protein
MKEIYAGVFSYYKSATTLGILHPVSPRCRSHTSRVTRSLQGCDLGDPRGVEMEMEIDGIESPIVRV